MNTISLTATNTIDLAAINEIQLSAVTAGMISTLGGMTTKFSRGVYYFYPDQQFLTWRHATAPPAPANEEIEQARSTMRFVFSRIFGRVN